MKKNVSDNRSTRRTRAAIQTALLSLMRHKRVGKITVHEIIDEANVCRTTFYAHYHDIYDLVEAIGNEIIAEVGEGLDSLSEVPVRVAGEYPTIVSVVRLYAQHADTIRLLNGPNGDPTFDRRLQDRIYEATRALREVKDGPNFHAERHLLYSCYVISGGISVLNRLLEDGRDWDPEAVGHVLGEMAATGERVFLKLPEQ